MKPIACVLAATATAPPLPALAWGFESHEIVAAIARADLTSPVRAKVGSLLHGVHDADNRLMGIERETLEDRAGART